MSLTLDLDKVFDIVPKEITFGVMRWMEVGDIHTRIVETMSNEQTSDSAICGTDVRRYCSERRYYTRALF